MYTYEPSRAFEGKWISDSEFYALKPRNVFHRQLSPIEIDCSEHRNRHILFRKKFSLEKKPDNAKIYVTADDFYKLYINGNYVGFGPASGYHFAYNYNEIDITEHLRAGENTIAVHTIYHGLINRVWQSGDLRHGLLFDLIADGALVAKSDESAKTAPHTAYSAIGTVGYDTQFLEDYDSRAAECGFELPDFDDSAWEHARVVLNEDHTLISQRTEALVTEKILPVLNKRDGNRLFLDFGSNLVGYLELSAKGRSGDKITVRCAQELNDDGSVRYDLRANCKYEESFILNGGISRLDWYDYKAFRYAELILPEGCEIIEAYFSARRYPFELRASIKPEYAESADLGRIWDLCVNTQKYGTQDALLDCMEREKGVYLGDGCYTALVNAVLTQKDDMIRKLIDDAFLTESISDTLLTCLDGSFIQEIAEFPLMLVKLILWHYRLFGDREYLAAQYPRVTKMLDAYRRSYESDGLLSNLDKWCVVEWPANFRDGYDVDLTQGEICKTAHVVMNAHYYEAVRSANRIADALKLPRYRDESELKRAMLKAFYRYDKKRFCDSVSSDHISVIGNVFPFAYGLFPEDAVADVADYLCERRICSLSLFGAFPMLEGLVRYGYGEQVRSCLLDDGAWLRMLREDATTTFEGWGRDTKWNTSLFHMTMSYAALFIANIDLNALFDYGE